MPQTQTPTEQASSEVRTSLAETISLSSTLAVAPEPTRSLADTATATLALRRVRLRAAALFLSVALGAALILRFFQGSTTPWSSQVLMLWVLVSVVVVLTRRRQIVRWELRSLELLVFLLMAGNLAVTYWFGMVSAVEGDNPVAFVAAQKNQIISSMMLMLVYAVFIPGTIRSASWVVLPIAVIPLVEFQVFQSTHQDTRLAEHYSMFDIGWNVNVLLAGGGLSLYGISVLNTLRQDVFEARRLNQYQLGECIGVGGMGEVYLAEHRLLKRICAIKLIRSVRSAEKKALTEFEREVRAAARLAHPNIVEVYDYGHTDDGTFYYVMEYLRGLSLADLVNRHGPLPSERVVYLLRQACEALAEAHASGLIHRDLKPANLFAARVGQRCDVTKVLDFGLAHDLGQPSAGSTAANMLVGTPHYMAPEQVRADPNLDHRADLYALGGVAYYLLTGQPPFDRNSAIAVMNAHVCQSALKPSQ